MSFPSSPSNNQTTIVNGITYVYNSSKNAWARQQTVAISTSGYLANSVIVANTDGYLSNVSNLKFYSSNNTLIVPNFVLTSSGGGSIKFQDGTTQSTAASGSGIDQLARDTANTANGVAQASYDQANVTIGVDASQNVRIDYSNTAITIIQGVDTSQNSRMAIIEGADASQNVRIDYSNAAITIIQGVDATQNTNIAATDGKMQSAYDQANTGGSGGSSSGYLANSVIFANTTGYLSNTSALLYYTSNNNLVLTGNVIAGGVRSTTSVSAPSNPTVGDIWYETTTDIIYRYINDGFGNYWLDITSPTTSNAASSVSGVTIGKAIAMSIIFGG
jgi:hypothetical protein